MPVPYSQCFGHRLVISECFAWYYRGTMSDKLSQDLKLLEIDRTRKTGDTGGRRWMVAGILLAVAIVIGSLVVFLPDKVGFSTLGAKRREVEITMVVRQPDAANNVVLTAG